MSPRKPSMLPLSTVLLLSLAVHAQTTTNTTKRGLAFSSSTDPPDNTLLQSANSPISWYYNWSPYPSTRQLSSSALEFVPLIHGIDGAESSETERVIKSLPASSQHLLAFNEPDGTTSSGGSAIEPEDAARAYIKHIMPYRDGKKGGGRKWKISHPSVTGSPRGLEWLKKFNESCYSMNEDGGCVADFVAAHWYGAFDGLAAWIGTLNDFYNGDGDEKMRIWITEMALPKADEEETASMMNATLPYLDGLETVERYAWFGTFRSDDANEWTGDGVALFDGDGGLTEVGALYLGGEENGFSKGQKGQKGEAEGVAAGLRVDGGLMCLAICVMMLVNGW